MKSVDWSKNLISTSGNYDPFVYRDADGIHIGDCGNHEIFQTVAKAREYAGRARLSGGTLSKSRAAAADEERADNTVAEYHWHQDAGLQIDALRLLSGGSGNHPNRSANAKIARDYIASRNGVERVRVTNGGEVHAYGTMPNSTQTGWYLAGYIDDLAAMARAENHV